MERGWEVEELEEAWQEVLVYFLARWGQASFGLGVLPTPSQTVLDTLRRSLELDGNALFCLEVDALAAADLYSWLEWTIPQYWGPGEDIGRIAMLLTCSQELEFAPQGADFGRLARRFPFPILLRVPPEGWWQAWWRRHPFLFPRGAEILPERASAAIYALEG